jgi:transposase
MFYLDESYLGRLNKRIIAELQKRQLNVTPDATGVGTNLFDRWLSHPTERSKDFAKLHSAIYDRGAAHAIAIADGTTNDSIVFPYLINDMDARLGVVRADAGYLSRDNIQLVEDLGAIPYIKPKSSSTMGSKGRFAWRQMHFIYQKDKEAFLDGYNQQRRVEGFFSRFKRRFGTSVKSRIGTMQRKEVWMRCLILNILTVAGEQIENELRAAG